MTGIITNWRREFGEQRASEINVLRRKQDMLRNELDGLRLGPIQQDQRVKLRHLHDQVASTSKELEKYPEGTIRAIKKLEGLHVKRNELLRKNELVLIVIQVKELDELISHSIPNDIQTAIDGLLQMTQLLDIVTDEQVKGKIVEIKNIHLDILKKLLPERLKDQLRACKWPEDIDDAVLDTLHWLTLLGLDPISPFLNLLELHFLVHFCTDRPTNRMDKPEWALGYLIKQLEDSKDLIAEHLVDAVPDFWQEYAKGTSRIGLARMLQLRKAIGKDLIPHYLKQVALFEHEVRTVFGVDVEVFREYVDDKWTEDVLDAYIAQMKESEFEDVELLEDVLIEIIRVLDDRYQVQFFKDALLPALNHLLQSILYQQPPFLSNMEEMTRMCGLVSRLDGLAAAIDGWSDELWMLGLESVARKEGRTNGRLADSLDLKHIVEEINANVSKMRDKLITAVFDRYSTTVNPFLTSMHYGLPTKHVLTMSDTFRRTLLDVSSVLSMLKRELPGGIYHDMLSSLETRMEKHMIDRLILKNYFHEQGVELFGKDVQALIDVFLANDGHRTPFKKLRQCLKVLAVGKPGQQSAGTEVASNGDALEEAISQGDMPLIAEAMRRMGIEDMTLEECEQVLASRRFEQQ